MDIKQALAALNPEDDAQWTGDGMPRVDVIAGLIRNVDVKRADITNVQPDFTREAAKLAAKESTDGEEQAPEKAPEKVEPAPAPVVEPVPEAPAVPVPAAPAEVVEVPIATATAPLTEMEQREAELAEATIVMNEAQKRLGVAKTEADLAANAVNALNRKIEVLHKVDPNHATAGIRAYLKQQNENRRARAGRVQEFLGDSGVRLRDLTKQFDGRSAIDAAMSVRKPQRGSVRPVR